MVPQGLTMRKGDSGTRCFVRIYFYATGCRGRSP
jgi:hypothetical protein